MSLISDRLSTALAGRYRLDRELGQGGMATVFLALDLKHERRVALKLLRPELAVLLGPERFIDEIRLTANLNHPHILPLLDSGEAGELLYYTMPFVPGESLRNRLDREGRLPVSVALKYARESADALDYAHRHGIVHRDVKPENILLHEGKVLLADFGVARAVARAGRDRATAPGLAVGTPKYMSPEQALGMEPDGRSDIYSLGCVIYEMVAGRPPFERAAPLPAPPPRLREVARGVPADLDRVVSRCLQPVADARYASAGDLLNDLIACQAALTTRTVRLGILVRRPAVIAAIAASCVALVAAGAWLWRRESRVGWARTVAIPEAARLVEAGNHYPAFRLLRRAETILPDDPSLQDLMTETSILTTVTSRPPGARIYIREFGAPPAARESLGVAPLQNVRVPVGPLVWEAVREGSHPSERLRRIPRGRIEFALLPQQDGVADMVAVPGDRFELFDMPAVELDDYWIERHEVTNRQFKHFVDHGGYDRRDYWSEALAAAGRRLSWEEARAAFRDRTGRPGPATWEAGTYPAGQADYPVGGISWFEAAAYCRALGRQLPTAYHWYYAAAPSNALSYAEFSNFAGSGPAPVGSPRRIGEYGTYDMAGNVKEWVLNDAGAGRRYILGGSWHEPVYQFREHDAQLPAGREPTYGVRCSKYSAPLRAPLTDLITAPARDHRNQTPVGDATFAVYRALYRYDPSPLHGAVDSVGESAGYWRVEHVSFAAAYGNERIPALLYLPLGVRPPYQVVVFAPGAEPFFGPQSFRDANGQRQWFLFLVRSGRAVLFPMFKGTYERYVGDLSAANVWPDVAIHASKDMGRAIDYLATRPDVDAGKVAFFALSAGAGIGTIMTAVEPRLRASILLAAGLPFFEAQPHADMVNFLPRIKAPTLMINGRNDFFFPLETAQEPMFRLLGTPAADKRHRVFESGHVPFQWAEVMGEALGWLDRYLGPVQRVDR